MSYGQEHVVTCHVRKPPVEQSVWAVAGPHLFFGPTPPAVRVSPICCKEQAHGCFGDRTTMGGGFNNNPVGALTDFDSFEGGGYSFWPFCKVTNVASIVETDVVDL